MDCWQIILVLIICAAALVQGDYILEIRVHRFQNPISKRFDGRCCDDEGFDNCSPCENMFLFCLRPPFFPNTSNDCPPGSYTTGVVSGDDPDDLQFPTDGSPIDTDVPNPLVFSGTEWPGGFQLYTRVEDVDESSEDDPIDRIFVEERNVIPSDDLEFSRTLQSRGEFGFGFIFVSYRVMCTGTSGGPNCTIDTENDAGTRSSKSSGRSGGNAGPTSTTVTETDDNTDIITGPSTTGPSVNGPSVTMVTNPEGQTEGPGDGGSARAQSRSNVALIGGVVGGLLMGLLLLVVAVLAVVLLCFRVRRQKEDDSPLTSFTADTALVSSTREDYGPGDNPAYTGTLGRHRDVRSTEDNLYHQLDNPLYGYTDYEYAATAQCRPGPSDSGAGVYYSTPRIPKPANPQEHQYEYIDRPRIPGTSTGYSSVGINDSDHSPQYISHYDRMP